MSGFVLCADDFGMTAGVSRGILSLCEHGRISATSAVTSMSHWPEFAAELLPFAARIDIGLHLNLTLGSPLTEMPGFAAGSAFPAIGAVARRALSKSLPLTQIEFEIEAQLSAFEDAMQRPPDYLDGHQHAHALPGIREAVMSVLTRRYGNRLPWLRDPADGPLPILRRGVEVAKALGVAAMTRGFGDLARQRRIATNTGFSGFSAFDARRDYGADFARFLVAPGTRHLVMCHPGEIDGELSRIDSVVETRPIELAYLLSERFEALCHESNLQPRRFADILMA